MANQEFTRASPQEGFSIARKVMGDAVDFHLHHGGPAVARAHVEQLANELKFYDDCTEAYREAMARISAAEEEARQKEEERRQHNLMMLLTDVVKPARKPRPTAARPAATEADAPVTLPPKLASEKAMRMWHRLQQEGLIDDRYQPVELSRTKAAAMADEMLALLSSENEILTGMDEKWTPFETLWGIHNMRADHYRALNQKRTDKFRGRIRKLLADIR